MQKKYYNIIGRY